MPQVTITVDATDFEQLWTTCMAWASAGWDTGEQEGQFEPVQSDAVEYGWKHAYWMGGNWASVVLARSFLAAVGHDFQVVADTADDPGYRGFVILSDCQDRALADRA
ncbi:hypothetical protein [Amycolatopsis rubida]|uniref:Uncharacterized protein n=1 Tax=Amycolatopsis rubida TaxID=112413 RepID=A0A1I6BM46_9PSEU|nr:hypothetical protein [Amycolatopsis rubida]SFQ82016.1 hypothetical protein SAMN05421854_13217 [Amycolatopsis rubida]